MSRHLLRKLRTKSYQGRHLVGLLFLFSFQQTLLNPGLHLICLSFLKRRFQVWRLVQAVQKVESISRLAVITFMLTVSKRILNLFRYIRTDVVRRTRCNKSLPYVVHMKITFKENRQIVYVAFLVLIFCCKMSIQSRFV